MERDDFEWEDGRIDVLIVDMAERCIKSQIDCTLLWDEIESIHEDFPGYFIVFALPRYGKL